MSEDIHLIFRYRHAFLKGQTQHACDDYFEDYQACVMTQLKIYHLEDLQKIGIALNPFPADMKKA